MSHSQSLLSKYISPQMIASSFMGMIMALPLIFTLSSSASRVNNYQAQPAVENQSTAQVTQADFAKYMYAYDQGYQAHTANTPTTTTTAPSTCPSPSSGPDSSDPVTAVYASKVPVKSHAPLAAVVNSYNSYVSTVNNSSTVTNTNSNNAVGSNNVTKTTIDAEELKGVTVDNSQNLTQVAAVDSFNKDSHNTKTDTTTINDSFNKQITIDSGNNSGNTTTTTNTANVTKTYDSNNTITSTENSNNTSNTTNTTTNTTNISSTVNKTIDSNNTSVDVNLGNGKQGGPHSQSV